MHDPHTEADLLDPTEEKEPVKAPKQSLGFDSKSKKQAEQETASEKIHQAIHI